MHFILSIFLLSSPTSLYAHLPSEKETVIYRNRLEELPASEWPKCLSIPEGGFVYYYHPTVGEWLEKPLLKSLLPKKILLKLFQVLKVILLEK